jgi:glycyl-tRNA synthetase
MAGDAALMDKLTALCKRRGFIYQSSEIYGGIGGFWDYGPLGVELKRNIKDAWWRDMVTNPPNGATGHEISMVGLDCAIIMNPKVWEASGHASGFQDPMVSCRAEGCRALFRADQVFQVLLRRGAGDEPFAQCSVEAASEEEAVNAATAKATKLSKKHGGGTFLATAAPYLAAWDNGLAELKCPRCDTAGSLTPPRQFNLMFETFVGALQDASAKAYLRPETAQGIFVNYQNVLDTSRVKVPFGIAQIGKSFRNEINPRNYTFRSREFEQMEIEFFCHDQDAMRGTSSGGPCAMTGTSSWGCIARSSGCATRPKRSWRTTPRRARTLSTCSRSRTSSRSWRAWPIAAASTCRSTRSLAART